MCIKFSRRSLLGADWFGVSVLISSKLIFSTDSPPVLSLGRFCFLHHSFSFELNLFNLYSLFLTIFKSV